MPEWGPVIRARGIRDDAIIQELAQHLEDRFNDARARGLDEGAASASALAELDGHEGLVAEVARREARHPLLPAIPERPTRWHAGLRQDLRDAWRSLRRSPAFAIAAIATVALTTGPTTGALAVANGLLRSIPEVNEPDRLASVNFGTPSASGGYSVSRISYQHMNDLVAAAPAVDGLAGWQQGEVSVASGANAARIVPAEFVSANYFEVLGVRLVAGRAFRSDEDRLPGGEMVAVLSARLARSLYPGADPIGQAIRINGYLFNVIGAAPAAFPGARIQESMDIWLPGMTYSRVYHSPPERWVYAPDRGPFYQHFARLARNVTPEQASRELRDAALALSRTSPDAKKFATVQPLLSPIVGVNPQAEPAIRSFVQTLTGTGLLLVLLGTANLANLFVFRALRRRHDTAVRRALGARTSRLVRLQLLETLTVAVLGGLAGVALVALTHALAGTIPISTIGRLVVPIDWRLLAMAFAMSIAVGVLMGFAPARLAARASLSGAIGQGARSGNRMSARVRATFATVQIALSLTLVVGALLLVATLRNIRGADAGFDARGVSYTSFGFNLVGYNANRATEFMRDLSRRLEGANPRDVLAIADAAPVLGGGVNGPVGIPSTARAAFMSASTVQVSPGFFTALGIELVEGRPFTDEEWRQSGATEPGVIVNERLASTLYGTTGVVGRPLTFGATLGAPQHDVPIVGVVRDVRWTSPDVPATPMLFVPGAPLGNRYLIVRSADPVDRVYDRIRTTAAAIDPALAVMPSFSVDSRITVRLGERRLFAAVSTTLALIGFVLAAIGVHGLVSQTVVERTREFGIRLAIGGTRAGIVRLVLRSAAVILAVGVPAGLLLAYFSSRLIASRLYGVTPGDVAPYLAGIAALVVVVLLAALVPARRASKANPVDVLRAE